MKIYLVGGAVRDRLLGRPIHERDWVVVGGTEDDMRALGYTPVGRDFPVFLHPETSEEYALARTERKSGHGYGGFTVHASPDVTLEQDLLRRDLTINAMAESDSGELIDPYGGLADLEARLLRHVSPAFAEDPLRVLRVARFAARYHHLGFRIADDTMALMREMVAAGEVEHLVAERVWKEISRALTEPDPDIFVRVLRECGALEVLLPEVDRLFGVPQPPKHHPEVDTGEHVLMALRVAPARLPVRFAVLVHDLGKGITPEEILPSHRGHERAGLPLVRDVCKRWRVPKQLTALAAGVCEYHLHCHRAFELRPQTLMKMLRALDALRRPERFEEFLQACEADARGREGLADRDYPQPDFLREVRAAAAAVGVEPLIEQGYEGAELGKALDRARIEAIAAVREAREKGEPDA